MTLELLLLLACAVLTGFTISQQNINARQRDNLTLLAGQFDQLQNIMHGYVKDTRAEFEKQLEAIENHYRGEMDDQ